VEVVDASATRDVAAAVRELTGGRGADGVVDAVGMEAHGAPLAQAAHRVVAALPPALARGLSQRVGVDRLAALYTCFDVVRRGGTVSLSGVYGGMSDPMPMMDLFDKGITMRMGQAHVRRWSDAVLELLTADGDPLGVGDLVTHRLPLEQAPQAYAMFQAKRDGCIKVVLDPHAAPPAPAGPAVAGERPSDGADGAGER
jgi:threonine dehydrogenase-like Zn-dependent dehydrogenase